LGLHYGGVAGGILLGGVVALLPLYIDFAAMSRPYSDAWAYSWMALCSAAVLRVTRRWVVTGLLLALAISSRIDMLAILALLLWQFWENPDAGARWFRPLVKAGV